jgi:hypothetical protein
MATVWPIGYFTETLPAVMDPAAAAKEGWARKQLTIEAVEAEHH